MPELQLVNIPDVVLAEVGTWECSTGVWECTREDLAAIVGAQDDPGIRTAVLKLGHIDARFDGQPAVGRVGNLRLSSDGTKLIGDYLGVPKWLAEVIASAFPSRSVEVFKQYRGSTGNVHAAVLTGVALLGVTPPAIATLDDVRSLYAGEYEELVAASHVEHAERVEHVERIEAAVTVDQVRSEFYEHLPAGSWAWIREVWVGDGAFLIVDDDDGELWQIPYTPNDDGSVEFGTPVAVQVQYVPSAEEASENDDSLIMLGRFHGEDARLVAASSGTSGEESNMPEIADLLALVGLPADATEEQYAARLAELAELRVAEATAETETTPPPAFVVPDGAVIMDEAEHAELVSAARRGADAAQRLDNQERDRFLAAAVSEGRIPPARVEHWRTQYDADPEGTRSTISAFAKGLIPVSAAAGSAGHAMTEESVDEAFWDQIVGMSGVLGAEEG